MKLGILRSRKQYHEYYARSCEELGVAHVVVDGFGVDWLRQVRESGAEGWLLRPPGEYPELRALYMDRARLIRDSLGFPVYPGIPELELYENKRHLADWLDLHGYPHPATHVFGRIEDALKHLEHCPLPVVIKTDVGSSGLGVWICRRRGKAIRLARSAFGRLHPAIAPGLRPRKFGIPLRGIGQRHTLFVQEFHPIRWEWRVIRIGNGYYGFKKLLKGDKASGSLLLDWVRPPDHLLDLVRTITDTHGFRSMAVDILETTDDRFLINEMQSLWGSYDPSQLLVDGVAGRLLHTGSGYRFEEGDFGRYHSYRARVEDFLSVLEPRK